MHFRSAGTYLFALCPCSWQRIQPSNTCTPERREIRPCWEPSGQQEPCSCCPEGSQHGLISRLSGVHVLLGWILCHEHGHNANKYVPAERKCIASRGCCPQANGQ